MSAQDDVDAIRKELQEVDYDQDRQDAERYRCLRHFASLYTEIRDGVRIWEIRWVGQGETFTNAVDKLRESL